MLIRSLALLALALATPAIAAPPTPQVHEVAAADPLRKTLLDALRPVIAKDLGQPVKFVVTTLRATDRHAFAQVTPQTPSGKPIDFRQTHYAQQQRDGLLDGDMIHALLAREQGRWVVKDFVLAPTDVAWAAWDEEYGAPRALILPD
ncbi:hypothetical protein FHS96_002115 [Sphingomonas zeicaulis]|uniref:hypothetical protein n=1 Tax=Sphingomonas zeicaulis TaxID=1632740 RepID=UPI003D246F62